MDDPIEVLHQNGIAINIYPDNNPESPREWSNLGIMVCFHRRYTLGDSHEFTNESFYDDDGEFNYYDDSPDGLLKYLERDDVISMPLYLYDHNVVAMSTSSFIGRAQHAEWDSGLVGYIYITKDKIRSEYHVKRVSKQLIEKIKGYLTNEVKVYSDYLEGSVYGYQAVCETCEKELDSCWGFYGYNWKENGLLDQVDGIECEDCKETKNRLENVTQLEFQI